MEKTTTSKPGHAMYVAVRRVGRAAVARVVREKISEHEADVVKADALAAAAAPGAGHRLVLDLSEVQMITSAGLGAMISIERECKAAGGKVVLFGMSDELQALFRMTKLDRLFVVKPDEAAAVAVVG